jgi:hypothetical protein
MTKAEKPCFKRETETALLSYSPPLVSSVGQENPGWAADSSLADAEARGVCESGTMWTRNNKRRRWKWKEKRWRKVVDIKGISLLNLSNRVAADDDHKP